MHVIVIGAGVIGIATAYELLKSGYSVSVIDQNAKPAMETSYANAGLIAPGHSYAWLTSKVSHNIFNSIFNRQNTFRFKFQWDSNLWFWCLQFLAHNITRSKKNTLKKYLLCNYSQKCFHSLISENNIEFNRNNNGLIYLFKSLDMFKYIEQELSYIKTIINGIKLLNRSELIKIEPALKLSREMIYGGLYCSSDESGDCRDFTRKLYEICKKNGAKFYFNTKVLDFEINNKNISQIITNNNKYNADIIILASASNSVKLAKLAGDYLPVYPVKGYSMTVPIIDKNKAPIHSGVDEQNHLAFSVMDNKIRFSSIAEISGYNREYNSEDFLEIIKRSSSLFPDLCDYSSPNYWCGLRPMTPNQYPIIKKSKFVDNIFYNTGHGHLGWTMCVGSAKIITNLVSGEKTDLSIL